MRETLFCFESSSKGGKAVSKEEKQRHGFVLDEGEEYSEGEGSKRQRRLLEVFLRDCFLRWLPASSYVDKFVL